MGKNPKKPQQAGNNLTPFIAPLEAVQNLLAEFGERGVIIGGIAAGLLGEPRFTADVDVVLLVEMDELPRLLEEAAARGIEARIENVEAFARHNRVLLLRHAASGIDVDIAIGMLPFESEMVRRSKRVSVGGLDLRLPTPEDLIILKAIAHRPKDVLDIDAVIANHPNLDKEHIHYWVRLFAEALEMPELLSDLEARLK